MQILRTTNIASLENARLRIPIAAYSKPLEKEAFARNYLDKFLKIRGILPKSLSGIILVEGFWVGWRARGKAPKEQT